MFTPVPPRDEPPRDPQPNAVPAHDNGETQGTPPSLDDVHQYVAECLARGSSRSEIRKQLLVFGYSAADASEILRRFDGVTVQPAQAPAHGSPNRSMIIGAIVCALGLCATCASMRAGGGAVIFYGAIIWGAWMFIRGALQSSSE